MTQPLRLGRIALVLAALLAGVAPIPARLVERWYSGGAYATLQPRMTGAANAVPFALIDALAAAAAVIFVLCAVRDLRGRRSTRAAWAIVQRTVVWSAAFYLAFLLLWGLNYRRRPIDQRLTFDSQAVTEPAASALASAAVARLNALHRAAHAEGFGAAGTIDPTLAGAFDRVARVLSSANRFDVGRPKHTFLDWYFQRAGVSGMTDPFFLETLIAGDLLPFERPFVVAHEWAHLAGLADEGEANLAGWITCTRAGPPHQYSAWLFMYPEALRALPPPERAAIAARLASGPRDDLQAIQQRLARHVSPQLSSAGWRVYDTYLKANRVEAGALSYEDVIRLALGLQIAREQWQH